jgi:hypothetical protein
MTRTALGHPLVREYLADLATAFVALPPEQFLELSEQITAHLEDALRPEAGDAEVAEVLQRLGPPAQLAAEAAAQAGSAEPGKPQVRVMPPGLAPRRRRFSVRRLRWRGWTLMALVVALLAGAGDLIALETAPTLQGPGGYGWWYPQDRAAQGNTYEITGETVSATPGRWGQEQGIVITVSNPSSWTQTILGPVPHMVTPGGVTDVQISVAAFSPTEDFGDPALRYTSPGSVPPHQTAVLRVLWRTTICQGRGVHTLVDRLRLRVRIGWVTRTENVPLDGYYTLNGASPQRYCAAFAQR